MAVYPPSDPVLRTGQSPEPLLNELVDIVRFLHQQGWTPATSSNFSCRTAHQSDRFYISASGKDKGEITDADFLEVTMDARPADGSNHKPSAETLLHALIYRHYPETRAVLHTHSVNATVLSKLEESTGQVVFRDFEILKALEGITTHEAEVLIPVFRNDQDMVRLSGLIDGHLSQRKTPVYGFLLAGHGLYTWGATLTQAKRHVEAFEFLMCCVLQLRSYGYSDDSRRA